MDEYKDFDLWNEHKKLTSKQMNFIPNEREICWCILGYNIGREQDGGKLSFGRPVLILKRFWNNTVLILPITSRVKYGKYYYKIFLNNEVRFVMLTQIRIVSTRRITRVMDRVDSATFDSIREELKKLM